MNVIIVITVVQITRITSAPPMETTVAIIQLSSEITKITIIFSERRIKRIVDLSA